MRRVIGMGVLAALLTAAAGIAWVDVLEDQRANANAGAAAPRYVPPTIEIGDGVGLDQAAVTSEVDRLVNDPRRWHANMGQFTLRIVLAGTQGTEKMPGMIGLAHYNTHTVVISDEAWTHLGPNFASVGGTLDDQRTWVVLHELGHMLGHYEHTECTDAGAPAPIMRSVNYDLRGCDFNVWPNPDLT